MEKATPRTKNKILKFFPKAAQAAAFSFQNLPFSPGGNKVTANRIKTHCTKGFSGPILASLIPPRAGGRSKNFESQEPTLPKVSCIGQVKYKKKIDTKKHGSLPKEKPEKTSKARPDVLRAEQKKKPSGIREVFGSGRKSDRSINYTNSSTAAAPLADTAPSLCQMRNFVSSREAFANFDWTTAQIAPEDNRPDFDSDEERGNIDGEDEFFVQLSAPALIAEAGLAVKPRKEINLWERRSMARPKPIKLNIQPTNF